MRMRKRKCIKRAGKRVCMQKSMAVLLSAAMAVTMVPSVGTGNMAYAAEVTEAVSGNGIADAELEVLTVDADETAETALANASVQSVTGAENWTTVGDFSISTSGSSETDYTYDADQKLLTIKSATPITIKNTDASKATDNRIYVGSGVSADVMLAGVNIACSSAPFEIAGDSTGDVTVTLADGTTNALTVNSRTTSAALQKNGAYSDTLGTLTIQCEHVAEDHVCSSACGSLSVSAEYMDNGAGIGCEKGYYREAANICIKGGNITARTWNGAGIGGGTYSGASYITISGGNVDAQASNSGAGIGGGGNAKKNVVSHIYITGGSVTAHSNYSGDGIGQGGGGKGCSDIYISGGSVKASSENGNPISGTPKDQEGEDGKEVYLLKTPANESNADVTVNGIKQRLKQHSASDTSLYLYLPQDDYTVSVGSTTKQYSFDGSAFAEAVVGTDFEVSATKAGETLSESDYTYFKGKLTINTDKGITIQNQDPDQATSDVIAVKYGVAADITLAGVNIDCSGTEKPAFLIEDNSNADVTITLANLSNNILSGGTDKPGLQRNSENDNKLTITCQKANEADHICDENCGSLKVTGNGNSAGIGGSGQHIVGNLSILGGNITVSADTGAGIGNGYNSENRQKTIDISGGNIDASSQQGSGIGYGNGNKLTMNLVIRGGRIKAAVKGSVKENFGIGGGWSSTSDYDANIKITGGSVNATSVKGQPTNEAGEKLYPLKISNVADADVTIDDKTYSSKLKDADNNLYIWLTAGAHTVNGVKANYGISKSGQLLYAPVKDDFTYTAPVDLTYDKTAKTATVSVKENVPYIDKTVIVKYVDSEGNEMTDLPVNAGTYTVKVCMDEASDDHIAAEIELGSFTIKHAVLDTSSIEKEKGFPCNDKVQKVSDVALPKSWSWDSTDAEKSLMAGTTVEAAAIYDGEDKDNYTEESRKITIQITKAHTDADGDGRCDISDCGAIIDGIGAKLAGYSLSLTGNIGVNFYMELSNDIVKDESAYLNFTLPNGTTSKVYVKGTHEDGSTATTDTTVKDGVTYYVFTCEVAAKEMTADIKAQMIGNNGEKTGKVYTYTVKEYADYILSHTSADDNTSSATIQLVKGMLNYGGAAQKYFGYKTDKLASDGLTLTEPVFEDTSIISSIKDEANKAVITNYSDPDKITFKSAYLSLNSTTDLCVYVQFAEDVTVQEDMFAILLDSTEISKDQYKITKVNEENCYKITLHGIKASQLQKQYEFEVALPDTGPAVLEYGATSYAYTVMSSACDNINNIESLREVVKALYAYGSCAQGYEYYKNKN